VALFLDISIPRPGGMTNSGTLGVATVNAHRLGLDAVQTSTMASQGLLGAWEPSLPATARAPKSWKPTRKPRFKVTPCLRLQGLNRPSCMPLQGFGIYGQLKCHAAPEGFHRPR
jgi:hypothetical protein